LARQPTRTRTNYPEEWHSTENFGLDFAACSEGTFCEKLTIVLHEDDVLKNNIDINELGNYLQHLCKYTEFAAETKERTGTAII
ncbi:MAG: hypothetical protein ACYCPD_08535, partial [Acidobacteriaceae bacterium]